MSKFNTIDELKRFLNSYKFLKIASDISRERYKEVKIIKDETGGLKATTIDGLPKAAIGKKSSIVENLSELLDKLERKYIKNVTISLKRLSEIEDIIILCDEKQQNILELHYIDGLSWEKVAERIGCSVKTAQNRHGQALQFILKKL